MEDLQYFDYQQKIIGIYTASCKVIPIFTVPIYIVAVYCLLRHSPKFQNDYIHVMTFHVILSCFGEIFGFTLMKPIVYLPIVGIYTDGFLSWLNVNSFVQVIIFFMICEINGALTVHLFIIRLKAIVPPTYKYYNFTQNFSSFCVVCLYSFSILSQLSFTLLYEKQDAAKKFWFEDLHVHVPPFFWKGNYIVASGANRHFGYFNAYCALSLILYVSVCIFLPSVSFYLLSRIKTKMSLKVIQAHKAYLRGLIMQVLVLTSFLLVPFAAFIIGLHYRIHKPVIIALTLTFAILHGAASTVALLIANKPYRDVLIMYFLKAFPFCRMSKPNMKRSSSTTVISI